MSALLRTTCGDIGSAASNTTFENASRSAERMATDACVLDVTMTGKRNCVRAQRTKLRSRVIGNQTNFIFALILRFSTIFAPSFSRFSLHFAQPD
jgi:hypothetical protein